MQAAMLAGMATVVALGLSPGAVRDGEETNDYSFSKAPVNSLGVQSLADLRGKPVLIDFWGTR